MNIAFPSRKRTATLPVLVGLFGAIVIAIVAGLADGLWTHDTQIEPRPLAPVSAPSVEAPRFLTVVLVATRADADYLRQISGQAEGLLPDNRVREDVVFLVAGTPEEESQAMSSIQEIAATGGNEPGVTFQVVDVRGQILAPQ